MNRLLTTISCTLLVCACEAQTMRVWMKDGSERQFAVSEIESVTFSEEETSMEQLKKEIEQFLDDWNDAMIAADTVRLGTMMDDGIILRHITGMTQTKHKWLEEVASGSMKYHKIEKRDVVVTSNSDGSARSIGAGKKILLGDISEKALERVGDDFRRCDYDVETILENALKKDCVEAFAKKAAELGPVMYFIDTAGASPNQANPEHIVDLDMVGTGYAFDAFGEVMAEGGAGLIISSQAAYMYPIPNEIEL